MPKARSVVTCVILAAATFAATPVSAQLRDEPVGAEPLELVDTIELEALDLDAVLAEDEQRAEAGLAPRFAIPTTTLITPDTDGVWETLDDDTSIWRLRVTSPDAVSLNFGFTRYFLPPGAKLLLRAADRSKAIRPLTDADNAEHGELWTPILLSQDVVLELTIPTAALNELELELTSINVGYRGFEDVAGLRSGSCNNDVVCPEGDPWRDQIASVAAISTGGSLFCSGFMINNTAEDETPYFMTAYHCGITSGNASSLVVYWNFESPTCGQQGGGSLSDWQSGSFFRSGYSPSDFTLVELDEAPNPDWNVSFAGWDRSSADPTSAVAIHHPNVDEKSISFEDDPCTTTGYLDNASPGDGTHIRVIDWDDGTTEGGSSGSPLFDQNQRVVGQLHGGYASCTSQTSDWYGRISVSWAGGGASSSRLSNWLDPISSGATTVETYVPGASGLRVTPSAGLDASGDVGGPFAPASKVYTLENAGDSAINYTVTKNAAWVSLTNASGSIPAYSTADVTVSLNSNADLLATGAYADTVTFENTTTHEGDTTRAVNLQVGVPALVYSFPLDTNPGWATQGQWAFGQPTGVGGADHGGPDPSSGYTGSNVYGYNLSGDYTNSMAETHLTTTDIDCSNLGGVTLRFRRWLNVEQPTYDHAYVRVSNNGSAWTTLWENGAEVTDSSWSQQEYDISAVADGQSTVYIRWTMGTTDGSWLYSGWNVDDVEIWGLGGATAIGEITAARSCATHDTAGELCIDLDAVNIEPRQSGATKLEFDVSEPATTVGAVVNCTPDAYSGSPTVTADGSTTVTVEFDPPLPDQNCCEITLSGDTEDSFGVRTIAGDTDLSGGTTAGDALGIKLYFGTPADASNAVADFNVSGDITAGDYLQLKLYFGNSAPACP